MVETSAQCRSSRNRTTGLLRARCPGRARRARASSAPATPAGASSRKLAIDDSSTERVATWRYQVGATVFISVCSDSPDGAVQQAVERLEDRQIGLGAGEPLRAAPARNDRPLRPGRRARRGSPRRGWSCRCRPRPRRRGSGCWPSLGAAVGAAQLRRVPSRGRPSSARERRRRRHVDEPCRGPGSAASASSTSRADGRRSGSFASMRWTSASRAEEWPD